MYCTIARKAAIIDTHGLHVTINDDVMPQVKHLIALHVVR